MIVALTVEEVVDTEQVCKVVKEDLEAEQNKEEEVLVQEEEVVVVVKASIIPVLKT
jgi:hypothetical protein